MVISLEEYQTQGLVTDSPIAKIPEEHRVEVDLFNTSSS